MAVTSMDNDFEKQHEPRRNTAWEDVQGIWDIREFAQQLDKLASDLATGIEESTSSDAYVEVPIPRKRAYALLRELKNRGIRLEYVEDRTSSYADKVRYRLR